MGGVGHAAVVVADLEVRVMILDVREMGEGVDEAHGAIEIAEPELPPYGSGTVRQHPVARDLCDQPRRFRGRQCRNTSFTGLAAPCGEVAHAPPAPRRA